MHVESFKSDFGRAVAYRLSWQMEEWMHRGGAESAEIGAAASAISREAEWVGWLRGTGFQPVFLLCLGGHGLETRATLDNLGARESP
jgi:hypothetical protein